MNRRGFLLAISYLPFLGFLKPAPEWKPWCVYTPGPLTPGETLYPGVRIPTTLALTDTNDWFLANTAKMKESLEWFDGPREDRSFDEFNLGGRVVDE